MACYLLDIGYSWLVLSWDAVRFWLPFPKILAGHWLFFYTCHVIQGIYIIFSVTHSELLNCDACIYRHIIQLSTGMLNGELHENRIREAAN